jgi:hypothetical protein
MAGLLSLRAAVGQAANAYRRPKLKITDIRTAEVRVHVSQVNAYTWIRESLARVIYILD